MSFSPIVPVRYALTTVDEVSRSNGDFSDEASTWVTNQNGGTHLVPVSFIVEDNGNVYVNDRGGYRYATVDEIANSEG